MYKVSSILLLLVVILFLFSCKEKSPTEPEDTGETVGEVTIGTSGGTLETDDVILNVPPLAFSSETNLKLVLLQEQKPNSASSLYRIEGLPLDFTAPLELKIKASNGSGENFIAVGEETFNRSLGTTSRAYNFLDATSADGFFSTDLAVPDQGSQSLFSKSMNSVTAETESINFYAVNSGSTNSKSGYHFVIKVADPSVSFTQSENLLNSLENAYNKFFSYGFSYHLRTNWPVTVNVSNLGENVFGYYSDSYWGVNYGFMEFNSTKLSSTEETKITAGHEFFHLVQSLYDPRSSISKARGWNYDHYWLDEASGVWAEHLFATDGATYASPITSTYQMQPFNGWQSGISIGAREHGYGMSTLIKYIDEWRYPGQGEILYIYQSIATGTSNPVSAILTNIPEQYDWMWSFYEHYFSGAISVYGVAIPFWRQNMHDTFTISSAADSVKTFSFAYPDLSARLYKIDINYSSIPEDASLNFSLTGDGIGDISIYRYKATTMLYVTRDPSNVSIPNLKSDYVDEGWNLFALVTNGKAVSPYTSTSVMDLKVKLENKREIKSARAKLNQFYGTISVTNDKGTNEYGNIQFTLLKEHNVVGSLSGHIFEADWDYTFDNIHFQGTMTLTFNESQTTILNFSISGSEESLSSSDYTEFSFAGSDIPITFQSEFGLEFSLTGTDLASHINSVSYFREYTSSFDGETTESLVAGTEYFVDFSDLVITCNY